MIFSSQEFITAFQETPKAALAVSDIYLSEENMFRNIVPSKIEIPAKPTGSCPRKPDPRTLYQTLQSVPDLTKTLLDAGEDEDVGKFETVSIKLVKYKNYHFHLTRHSDWE